MTLADRIRNSGVSDEIEGDVTPLEVVGELKRIYLSNDSDALLELRDAFIESEAGTMEASEDIIKTVDKNLDWYSQINDAVLRTGREISMFVRSLGHAKKVTGPVCDFYRQTTNYYPDF